MSAWVGGVLAVVLAGSGSSAAAAGQVTPGPTDSAATDAGAQPAAKPGAATRVQTYDAAYFARYAPSTALDVVNRVPGFALEQVDTSVRGFAQAAGNVVINGQRPSSKTDTVQEILSRIPASRVVRVELGPGDLYGADFAAKAQVLNVVTSAGGGLAGTVTGAVRRDFTGTLYPEGSASVLLHRGKSTFNAAATFNNEQTSEEGYDRLVALPSDDLIEHRRKVNRIREPNGSLSASWGYDDGADRQAHVNAQVSVDRFVLDQANHVEPVGAPARDDALTERYHTNSWELGGDVTRPLAGGGLKLVALASRRDRLDTDVSLTGVDQGVTGAERQVLDDRLDERLARLSWSRPKLGGWAVEAGAEGVINRLDSAVDLTDFDASGTPTPIDLPIDHAVVREVRGEAFVNAGRPIAPKLRLDLGLAYEASHLTVRGDADAERTLGFLKPKATLDWHPSRWHAQLSLQRTVAQLQFEDFISSAQLSTGQVSGGNPNLEPQRAWEALATIERPILGDGLIKLELGYDAVEKVQDRVPTPDGLDAPGNLGNGHIVIVRPRVELPLKAIGLKGARVTLYGSYVSTSVRDPYTFRDRPFSGNALFYGQATFRQDLKHVAWGFSLEGQSRSTFFRLDELDTNYQGWPFVSAFVEWRPDAKTTLTATLDNLTQADGYRRRTFFDPDRRTPDPDAREYRFRAQHVIPSISFKRSFG